jgi:hypothetical protein
MSACLKKKFLDGHHDSLFDKKILVGHHVGFKFKMIFILSEKKILDGL